MTPSLRFAAVSDVGRVRRDNQDSGYAGPHLLAVADGVGGSARGDLASATAIRQIRRLDTPPDNDMLGSLENTLLLIHDRLAELVRDNPEVEGTSTTFTGLLYDGDRIGVTHVGDSRAYLLRDGEIRQLTTDHTFVQSLVDEGRISAEEARTHPHRNMILRAVDSVHDPEPDSFHVDVQPGDRLLVCSDGCCGSLTDDRLAVLMAGDDLDVAAHELVTEALDAGSSDNVTVVVAEVLADQPEPQEPIVVGAAAGDPKISGSWKLPWLQRSQEEEPADPEALRYAPRARGRFGWLRRLAVLGVSLVLLWLAGSWAYSWTQTQYFVGSSDGRVTIFKGVEADLPGINLNSVYERSDISLDSLPEHTARDVRNGRPAGTLGRAREIVSNLRVTACGRASTPVVTKTVRPTKRPSPRVGATATPQSQPKPSLTTITPSTAPTGDCEPAP